MVSCLDPGIRLSSIPGSILTNPHGLIKLLSFSVPQFLCLMQHNCCEDKIVCIKSQSAGHIRMLNTC